MIGKMLSAPVDVIVFDLFNTLIHTPEPNRPLVELMRRLALTTAETRQAKRTLMTQPFSSLAEMGKALKPGLDIETEDLEALLQDDLKRTVLFTDTIPALTELKTHGWKLVLLSNLATPYKSTVDQLGLTPFFTHCYFSCDEGLIKPHAELYQRVTSQFAPNDPKNALMVGDSLKADYRGGANAGLQSILIDRAKEADVARKMVSLTDLTTILST